MFTTTTVGIKTLLFPFTIQLLNTFLFMSQCHVLLICCSLCFHPPCLPFVALAVSDVMALSPVSLVILDRTSEFRSRHESSSGRRSVRMFTLCNDPALQPRDIFPPVVTHGKGNIYQPLRMHTSLILIIVFIDVQDVFK